MRLIRSVMLAGAIVLAAFGTAAPAGAAKPCNQYPTFIQPITCRLQEKLP